MKIHILFEWEKLDYQKNVSIDLIKEIVHFVGNYFYFTSCQYLVINFVSSETMKIVNWQYYPFKKVSRVLSFPFQKRTQSSNQDQPWGEIYFCLPAILKRCDPNTSAIKQEIKELLIHSLLHLLDYHHQSSQSWKLFQQLQQEIITTIDKNKKTSSL